MLPLIVCVCIQIFNLLINVSAEEQKMMSNAHSKAKGGPSPVTVSRFLSPHSKEESAKNKDFFKGKVHTQIASAGRLKK